MTETGYTTAPTPRRTYWVTPARQAAYLPRLFRALDQQRVRMIVWYNLQDHRDWPPGLLTEAGRRKPSWAAFRRVATR